MFRLVIYLLLTVFSYCFSYAQGKRPRQPWVFRSVMDDIPRALTLAFHQDIWTMYDVETSELKKIWQGGSVFVGEVYNAEKIAQPKSTGNYYLQSSKSFDPIFYTFDRGVWQKVKESSIKEYRFDTNQVTLLHEIILADNQKVVVVEQPQYDFETKKFTRSFVLHEGKHPVYVQIQLDQMVSYKDFSSKGIFRITEKGERTVNEKEKRYFMRGMLEVKDRSEISVRIHPMTQP